MKAVVAFFLACLLFVGSLIPQNDLAELSKLPQLLEHYRYHHSAAGGGLSLATFLAEHYGAGTRHLRGCTLSSQHQQDHRNLPLRDHTNCTQVVFLPTATRVALPPAARPWAQGRAYRRAAATGCPDGLNPALLQPPRA